MHAEETQGEVFSQTFPQPPSICGLERPRAGGSHPWARSPHRHARTRDPQHPVARPSTFLTAFFCDNETKHFWLWGFDCLVLCHLLVSLGVPQFWTGKGIPMSPSLRRSLGGTFAF